MTGLQCTNIYLVFWIQLCTIHLHLALPALFFELSYISSVTGLGPINHVLVSHPLLPLTWICMYCYNTQVEQWILYFISMYHFPYCCYYVLLCTAYRWVISCILWQINIYWTITQLAPRIRTKPESIRRRHILWPTGLSASWYFPKVF